MPDLPPAKVAKVHPGNDAAHRIAEDRLQAFMEKTPLVAWVKDEDFHYQYVNARFEKYFNIPHGQAIGLGDEEFVPREVAEKLHSNDLEVLKEGKPVEFIEHVPDASGKIRSWLVVKFPIPGTKGGTAVAGTAQEITERLKLEGENQLTGFALEHAGVAFYLLDSHAKILRVNKASCAQTGYSQEELLGASIQKVDRSVSMRAWPQRWKLLKKEGFRRFESEHQHQDGTVFPVEVESNFVEFEGGGYNVCFVRDITERQRLTQFKDHLQAELKVHIQDLEKQRAEALALAEENRLIDYALAQSMAAFFLVGHDARILRVNESACWQSGFPREELLQMTIQDLNPASTMDTWRAFWEELKEELFVRFEGVHLCKEGSTCPVEIEANYLEYEGKGYNVCFVRDISQRKEWAERQQRQKTELEDRVKEHTLELNRQRLASLKLAEEHRLASFGLEHASVAFFLVDGEARILRVNRAACKMSGYKEGELQGMTVHDIDPTFPVEAWAGHRQELKEKGYLCFESWHKGKNGQPIPTEVEANYIEFEGIGYNFTFVRDISKRRQWEKKQETLQSELEKRVEARTQELNHQKTAALELASESNTARLRAIAAERELAEVTGELALPQSQTGLSPHPVCTDKLSLNDIMLFGRVVRALCNEHNTLDAYCENLAKFFQTQFLDNSGQPCFGLVLIQTAQPFSSLTRAQQEEADNCPPGAGQGMHCLVTRVARCINEEWGSLAAPYLGTCPMGTEQFPKNQPLAARLLCQLGHEFPGVNPGGLPNAENLTAIYSHGDAEDYLLPFARLSLETVTGFGQELVGDQQFTVTLFSTAPLDEEAARLLVHLSHSVRLGMLHFAEHKRRVISQVHAVDSLLLGHEAFAAGQEERLLETMDALTLANKELSRSNEELDKFAFAASHDLKSPLFAIRSLVSMIEEDYGRQFPDELQDMFNRIAKRVGHMDDLLDSLLGYSRIGHQEDIPSPQSIGELLDSLLHLLVVPRGIRIHIPDGLPTLVVPRGALLRVFGNLISNALKHGGREDLEIRVGWRQNQEVHRFSVSDNGVGIPAEHHKRVFDMFQSLAPKHEGTGMGLALVKKTIDHFGCTISLESTPGEGTCFSFTWPVA